MNHICKKISILLLITLTIALTIAFAIYIIYKFVKNNYTVCSGLPSCLNYYYTPKGCKIMDKRVTGECKRILDSTVPLTHNSRSFCYGVTSVVPACQCYLKSTVGSLFADWLCHPDKKSGLVFSVSNISEPFQDLPASQYSPFIFAGYHEIYDYIISSALVKHVNMQTQLTNDKPEISSANIIVNKQIPDVISFASIPRIYIYVSQGDPNKAHLVFTKLKKSDNLIRLYNKQIIGRKLPDAEINKTVDVSGDSERASITDEQYDTCIELMKKYNFGSAIVNFDDYVSDIRLYILYMLESNPGFMYNVVLTDAELKKLDISREKVTPPNSGISITFNTGVDNLFKGEDGEIGMNRFTTLLNGKELIPVINTGIRETLMQESAQSMEVVIKEYLFKNRLMATNISASRVALFKMNIVNPYQVNIFYILKDTGSAQDELSNKELENKFNKSFTPDLSPEKLAKYAALYKANPKQKMFYNPDLECFVVVNKFQLVRVVLKRNEKEL